MKTTRATTGRDLSPDLGLFARVFLSGHNLREPPSIVSNKSSVRRMPWHFFMPDCTL